MQILIHTVGSAGDVHPFIAIGQGLAARGHDVTLFANETFSPIVQGAGVRFVPSGRAETFRRTVADPDLLNPRKSAAAVLQRMVVPDLEDTIGVLDDRLQPESVLVGSTLSFATRMLRELRGAPLVTVHLSPVVIRSNHRMPKSEVMWIRDGSPTWLKDVWWRLVDVFGDRAVGREFQAMRGRLGLRPARRVFRDWIHSPDRTLGLFPPWFAPPQPDWHSSIRLTGFPFYDQSDQRPPHPDLDSWLDEGDKPIVFTAGTANAWSRGFFETAVRVARDLDRRAVLVTTDAGALPPRLSDSVRHEEYVPFGRLFPRATAVVSHGGIGTTAQALAAGIPHLVVHTDFDQRENGSRLADLGCGDVVSSRRFGGRRASEAMSALLAPEMTDRAREQADAVDREALAVTCAEIEGVVGDG